MDKRLIISWEEPAQPNDYTVNYTVTITDINTYNELSRTTLDMDQLSLESQNLSKCRHAVPHYPQIIL